MLYLIGGAACSGKSSLARELLKDKGFPYFSIDFLFVALRDAMPQLGLDKMHTEERAEIIWPYLYPIIKNLIEFVKVDYVIEGSMITPDLVASAIKSFPGKMQACFLGYCNITPQDKLKNIRKMHGKIPNDWLIDMPDSYILELAKGMNELSRYFLKECKEYNISYFDEQENFEDHINKAYKFLIKDKSKC